MVSSLRVVVASAVALLAFAQPATPLKNTQVQTSLKNAPSVKLHVTLKRKSMKLHSQSEFDVYATPVVSANGASVLYNSYATFLDEDEKFTYTVVNGAAYLSTIDDDDSETVRCLPPNTLPFDKILPALNDATPIPSASIGKETVECESGKLFKTTFSGAHFALCSSGKSGFTAVSSDLAINVTYLDGPITISQPELTDGTSSCEPVESVTSMTPTALALATGGALPSTSSRKLKEAAHMAMDASECGECLTTPRPCIFLHGLGNPNEEPTLQDTPKLTKRKFGDIHGHAPCCSEIKYAVINTNNAGWRNDTLQQKFCDFLLQMSPTSDVAAGIIDNTIVVTHSMGGLVMAGALAKGKCKFSKTTSWVALSAPMTGSMASDFLMDICNSEKGEIATSLFELVGQCPTVKARKSTIYQGEKYSTPSIDAAYVAAQEAYRGNVSAAMCSDNFFGLFSSYSPRCILGGTVIPHKSKKNDALVEFQSCLGGLDEALFGTHYLDRFYKPQLNHADTAFLNGDGLLKDSQKPMKWFECLSLPV
ncbi:hypothetical protein PF005_g21304 [Phytophthora fragariae]|uniref:AB hydrolase-1 domain-containing protein n=3 Tax=Phytophthora fragariae TaxID=53985 RepID=A0A6A3WKU5_9STRA|nr:hypothetical protein PF003_g34359 [Phytophthora fragariae]KAE9185322.1 hypothetical protein PF005_g21304 [Phytophthora fragariae]